MKDDHHHKTLLHPSPMKDDNSSIFKDENDGFIYKKKVKTFTKMDKNIEINDDKKFILCINTHQNCNCSYAHSLTEWRPKTCNFQKTCKKGKSCPYFHNFSEDKSMYLKRMIKTNDSFYFKNATKFSKYI